MIVGKGERIFRGINYVIISVVTLVMLIPVWHVLMYSLSDPTGTFNGFIALPRGGFSLGAYRIVLRGTQIRTAYKNTVFVVLVATFINIVMSFLAAYPLSKKYLKGRSLINYFIFFTMLFSGGLIPTYMIVLQLGLINSLWSLIIPSAVSAYNIFVLRNFIQTIPEALSEAAKIDGANEAYVLFKIILPLSKPVIAVLALFYGVGHWNSWFNCVIYINDFSKYTLQPIVRQLLFTMSALDFYQHDPDLATAAMPEVVKMATVAVATIPILMVYPFLQKYFIKGVMVGAVKG